MLVSQRSAYMLQEKMDKIKQMQDEEISSLYPEGNTMLSLIPMIKIIQKYNRLRQRAIWWAQYQNDLVAGVILLAVIGLGVYFVLA